MTPAAPPDILSMLPGECKRNQKQKTKMDFPKLFWLSWCHVRYLFVGRDPPLPGWLKDIRYIRKNWKTNQVFTLFAHIVCTFRPFLNFSFENQNVVPGLVCPPSPAILQYRIQIRSAIYSFIYFLYCLLVSVKSQNSQKKMLGANGPPGPIWMLL